MRYYLRNNAVKAISGSNYAIHRSGEEPDYYTDHVWYNPEEWCEITRAEAEEIVGYELEGPEWPDPV